MEYIELPSKPGFPISYRLSGPPVSKYFVVFVNGLGLSAQSWNTAIEHFRSINTTDDITMLTYDRFGQGQTVSRDPLDDRPNRDAGYGHDITDAAKDLDELVTILTKIRLESQPTNIILVAASIGVHIARLFAAGRPSLVRGILLLDSNMGNLEYSDLWPDHTAPDFDPRDVIDNDCTLEQYIQATGILAKMFNSNVKNAEGLDRRNIKRLLPYPSEPKLGTHHRFPYVSVVGHDPARFAEESFERLAVPRSLSMKYINPKWAEYNEQLLQLTDPEHQIGVALAKGCGHFIQRDDPEFVATKLHELLRLSFSED